MSTDMYSRTLTREQLPNGLTVVLAPDRRWARVAVSVHHPVGFRSERPGQEGFAHLFEHLMFQGSESLPDARFHDHVRQVGGTANGTTHQDYTDYYQVVPESSLERALFAEADRMRAPAFTERGLAVQLEAVAREIHDATVAPPLGGLPWPLLPKVVYDSFANAHDGYGDIDRLRASTVEDCARFFQEHYSPDGAVLTITGGFDPQSASRLVREHFGDVPARRRAVPPRTEEGVPERDRWAVHTHPGLRRKAVTVGYRLPDPATDLAGYLAHVVLADLVVEANRAGDGTALVRAGCGFFGPLDTRSPDTMVVSVGLPSPAPHERFLEVFRVQLDEWGRGTGLGDEDVERSVAAVLDGHLLDHADLATRCRALGRLELLFGRAELLDELPGAIARVGLAEVRAAARALAVQPAAGLVVVPGDERTRPEEPAPGSPAAPPGTVPRSAASLARTPRGPRLLPALGPARPARLGPFAERTTRSGMRVVAVHDDRSPHSQVRARLPLGALAWSDPDSADALAGALDSRVRMWARARGLRDDLVLTTDGQWLDVTGTVEAARTGDWLEVLGVGLAPIDQEDLAGPPSPVSRRTEERTADDVLRRIWMAGGAHAGGHDGAGSVARAHRAMVSTPGGALVIVGDVVPELVVEQAERMAVGWPPVDYLPVGGPPAEGSGLTTVERVGIPGTTVTLSRPEPLDGGSEAARYLACAVFGGYSDSRIARLVARRGADRYMASAGRDRITDLPRVFVRARLFTVGPQTFLDEINEEAHALERRPPGRAEVDRAREYCLAQLLTAHDSPAQLAEVLRATAAMGHGAHWMERMPRSLETVTASDVAQAVCELFTHVGGEGVAVVPKPAG